MLLAGVLDESKLRFNSSKAPAGSNLGEHNQILKIQSSAPDDGQKHGPKHVELTWNNKLIYIYIYIVHFVGYFCNFVVICSVVSEFKHKGGLKDRNGLPLCVQYVRENYCP